MRTPVPGGIVALRGFDYQATVILDCLITHFDEHGMAAAVRPEGIDDLDLKWTTDDGATLQRYVQIKKPREDRFSSPTGKAWTVAEIATELVPGALVHLKCNDHEQVWILGDEVEEDVSDLINAGCSAPHYAPVAYWRVVHSLARAEAVKDVPARTEARTRLMRWSPPTDCPSDPEAALALIVEEFTSLAIRLGLDASIADNYAETARRTHLDLPVVLDRVCIETLFGSEDEVARRVRRRLEIHYGLDQEIVEATLFRNLRGFINDIAKQPGRHFDRDEFELELRSVWPMMMPVTYSRNANSSPGTLIRPALIAANIHDVPVKWHREILSSPYSDKYISRMFAALAAMGEADAFYRVLYQDPQILLPHLCSYGARQQIGEFLDDRMIPFLRMHLTSGTEEILEGLCGLARAIESPAVDAILSGLFRRWTGHFEAWRRTGHLTTSHHMWRAFRDLTEHPRFDRIEDWQGLLLPVMQAPMRWFEKQMVTRVLERDSRSYVQLESLLFRSEDWETFFEDEIDRLQEVAERLFQRVNDQ